MVQYKAFSWKTRFSFTRKRKRKLEKDSCFSATIAMPIKRNETTKRSALTRTFCGTGVKDLRRSNCAARHSDVLLMPHVRLIRANEVARSAWALA